MGRQKDLPELLRGEGADAVIVGDAVLPLRSLHAVQIRQRGGPHVPGICRDPGGGGVEGRQNGRAVIEDDLPVGIPHCLLHLGLVLLRLVPPPGRCVLLRYVGAAAGRGGTDIRLRMGILTSARHVVADEGTLRHSLSVQRLLGEGGGHLPPHHPRQILRHGHLPQLLPVPHGEGNVRIRPLLLSGERLRRSLSPLRGLRQPRDAEQQKHQHKCHRRTGTHGAYLPLLCTIHRALSLHGMHRRWKIDLLKPQGGEPLGSPPSW